MKYGACAQFNAYCGSEAQINIQSCIIRKQKVQVCNLTLLLPRAYIYAHIKFPRTAMGVYIRSGRKTSLQ